MRASFRGPTLQRPDQRKAYGEKRVIAIGLADSLELTVVYTDRGQADRIERRIISARRSNRHERKAYQASLKGA
ncbi:MAG: BrnT family toxin [Gemmatimonadales bacterium]